MDFLTRPYLLLLSANSPPALLQSWGVFSHALRGTAVQLAVGLQLWVCKPEDGTMSSGVAVLLFVVRL